VFGALANSMLSARLRHPPAHLSGPVPRSVDGTSVVLGQHSGTAPDVVAFVRGALTVATHQVFWALFAATVVMGLGVLLMPRRTVELEFD